MEYLIAIGRLEERLRSGKKWIHRDRLRGLTEHEHKGLTLLADKLEGIKDWKPEGWWALDPADREESK